MVMADPSDLGHGKKPCLTAEALRMSQKKACIAACTFLYSVKPDKSKNKNQGVQAMAWKTIWTYLEIIRAIQSQLEPFDDICSYLVPFGDIFSYLEPFGEIWSHLKLFGTIWSHFKLFFNAI